MSDFVVARASRPCQNLSGGNTGGTPSPRAHDSLVCWLPLIQRVFGGFVPVLLEIAHKGSSARADSGWVCRVAVALLIDVSRGIFEMQRAEPLHPADAIVVKLEEPAVDAGME